MDSYALEHLEVVVFAAVAVGFACAPLLLARLVAPRKPSQIKQDTYECGLPATGDPWVRFHVQYYVYALAFVAFDLEAPFIYAWAVVFKKMPVVSFLEMLLFIGVLMVGLLYAWRKGVLDWSGDAGR